MVLVVIFSFGRRVHNRLNRQGQVGEQHAGKYGDDHWKWHVSGGPVLGANETREFIIRSLGATRKGGG